MPLSMRIKKHLNQRTQSIKIGNESDLVRMSTFPAERKSSIIQSLKNNPVLASVSRSIDETLVYMPQSSVASARG